MVFVVPALFQKVKFSNPLHKTISNYAYIAFVVAWLMSFGAIAKRDRKKAIEKQKQMEALGLKRTKRRAFL